MEQQNFSPQGQPGQSSVKPIWLIVLVVLVVALIGVLFWQKSIANQMADSLQKQIIALQNQISQKASQQIGQPANCIKEGEEVSPATKDVKCCGQGVVLKQFSYLDEGKCVDAYSPTVGPTGICIACGNGVCGTGENQCNCPADCKSATTSNETAGWKKHGNVYAGYGVKYPSDWIVDSPQIYNDVNSQIKFYSELFHPLDKESGGVVVVLYEFSSKISLAEAVKRVTGISGGEQTKIGIYDALKVGQWPDLGMPNGAYFLLYPSGTLFGINYTSHKDGIEKVFEEMVSSLVFMPAQ